jgi:protein gp37
MWFGFSVSSQKMLENMAMDAKWLPLNSFISIEPMRSEIELTNVEPTGIDAYLNLLTGGQYWFMGGDINGKKLKWVILGAQTGPGSKKKQPKPMWIAKIVAQCKRNGVSLFLKNNLGSIVGNECLIQEFPRELQK